MQIGMVGLGRMGGNMARRLLADGHQCVVHDLDSEAVAELEAEGAVGCEDLDGMVEKLAPARAVWVMVPAGEVTTRVVDDLLGRLSPGDAVIDGGNGFFRDDLARARGARERGVDYLDVGTSGGVWGLERGYCLMIGGPERAVDRLTPIWSSLAPGVGAAPRTADRVGEPSPAESGWLHCGPVGSGHFVKMIHNGIEYGMMQAYAEGFELLAGAGAESLPEEERFPIDAGAVAEVWRRGSVVGSWLLDLAARALADDPGLEGFEGRVGDSGEGRWTVQTAVERGAPAAVLTAALHARFRSRGEGDFGDRLLSALRHQFGGHVEPGGGGRS